MSQEPIIILGAARSGTKLLRDTLAAAEEHVAIPYDVNYIWRYSNERYPSDALPASLATDRVQRFVCGQLSRMATLSSSESNGGQETVGPQVVIEKTVGNVLRLPFVHCIYPDARYVFLIRDGRDVIESAIRCWQEPPPVSYLVKKMRYFPWRHCGRYGMVYARQLLNRVIGLTPHLESWGPRYAGMDDDLRDCELTEVCARQWVASVEAYEQARSILRPEQLIEVRYEELVQQPQVALGQLCEKLQIDDIWGVMSYARSHYLMGRIGRQSQLSADQLEMISGISRDALERWGYVSPRDARIAA